MYRFSTLFGEVAEEAVTAGKIVDVAKQEVYLGQSVELRLMLSYEFAEFFNHQAELCRLLCSQKRGL